VATLTGLLLDQWPSSCFAPVMGLGHPAPLRNFDYIGMHYCSLTWCCYLRQTLFTQRDRVHLVRGQILRACEEAEIEIIVDCYMPDHLHQLIHGRSPTADGRKFIRKAKQYSGFHFAQQFEARLWQRFGQDRVLWNDRDIQRVVRYIIENPVRAGLAQRAQDYPFIGSHTHTLEELLKWADERRR
jgi:putative transposase